MKITVVTWGNNGKSRKVTFLANSKEEVQDLCREALGKIPLIYRQGIPSPVMYRVISELE